MARLLVLPGTAWQIPLIRRIREMGHEALVVNPVWHPDVVGLADVFLESDIFAVDDVERFARLERADGVLSDACDVAMPVVAELGKRLGVPALSREAARLFTNKALMRGFAERIGMEAVEHRVCETADDAVDFLRELGVPIVLKPLDSNASHGVFTAETEQDARARFGESLSFSRTGRLVLAERHVSGPEFTVDGVKTPAGHQTLAISEKGHFPHNESIANELVFSHSSERYDYDALRAANDRLVEASPSSSVSRMPSTSAKESDSTSSSSAPGAAAILSRPSSRGSYRDTTYTNGSSGARSATSNMRSSVFPSHTRTGWRR